MEHLACFAPGMLELGFRTLSDPKRKWHDAAEALTRTCHKMYAMTKSGLSPETARFDDASIAIETKAFYLRPETAESVFYMWYFTQDDRYRRMAVDIFRAMKKLKTKYGYAEAKDVSMDPPPLNDVMQSYFISETLMYLYLTFAPHGTVNLTKQVFNTEGHPLPIAGLPGDLPPSISHPQYTLDLPPPVSFKAAPEKAAAEHS